MTHDDLLKEHLNVLESELSLWRELFTTTICLICLCQAPDFTLPCGHAICRSCVETFGRKISQETYNFDHCPLCLEGSDIKGLWTQIRLKPTACGVRVLAVDGGGARGAISAQSLALLERELGLGIPLFHFFDVIMGTSSGKDTQVVFCGIPRPNSKSRRYNFSGIGRKSLVCGAVRRKVQRLCESII